jgi:SAM-dependent methyltransferase
MKLNIGCGKHPLEGYTNVDQFDFPGVDIVCKLGTEPLPLEDDSVDAIQANHVLEHLANPLPFMAELYRVARHGCIATFVTPYGASNDAWEDPTHVRPYFPGNYYYFSQLAYFNTDYGYRGDWELTTAHLTMLSNEYEGLPLDAVLKHIDDKRNQVREMTAILTAVKPAREPMAEPQTYQINIHFPSQGRI